MANYKTGKRYNKNHMETDKRARTNDPKITNNKQTYNRFST